MTVPGGDELPTLAAGRLELRPLTEADLESLFELFSDSEVMRYWSHAPFADFEDAEAYLEEVRRGIAAGSFWQWGVSRADDDLVIGTCTLWQLDRANRRCEIGFALRRDHWGGGWMREALTRLLDFAFSELGLLRIEADVDPDNAASIALLEHLGFVREGYMRERWLVEGEAADSVFFGLLARDWPASSRSAE